MSTIITSNAAREVHQSFPVLANTNTSRSAAVGCSALSQLATESSEMRVHAFPATGWVFNMAGQQFTVTMKEGQLVATPYQSESATEFCGVVAASKEQAVNQVTSRAVDFCLFKNEEGADYSYTLVFMDDGSIASRPVNFTTGGAKNGGDAVFANVNEFYKHTVTYSAKYAVPVS